jgi:type IV secretion system protein TrbC
MSTSSFVIKILPRLAAIGVAAGAILAVSAAPAYASASGTDLPWNTSLNNLMDLLSGNLVKYVCLTAIFIGGTALIFGEDLGTFTKRLLTIAIAAAVLIGAGSFFTGTLSGAIV